MHWNLLQVINEDTTVITKTWADARLQVGSTPEQMSGYWWVPYLDILQATRRFLTWADARTTGRFHT
jgi:hypothetical protein